MSSTAIAQNDLDAFFIPSYAYEPNEKPRIKQPQVKFKGNFEAFIAANLRMPDAAIENKIDGKYL
ncbi:MAG TPA: hypothetical protein VF691_03310 [Cytophagaceae bacterium]|jgi:hypothetical protein